MRVRHFVAFALLEFAAVFSHAAIACSMCRCGDATFNALGPDVFTPGQFRLAVDWDRFEKESGPPEMRDAELESRITATLSYSFGDRVTAMVRVPWSARHLTSTDLAEAASTTVRTRGLSDPELTILVKLWAAPFVEGIGRRSWVSVVGGVKTPWGRNDLSENGERLDEHVQTGTGSTDVFGGFSGALLIDRGSSVFASIQYRRTGTNDFGYRYGSVLFANLAYERKVSSIVDTVLELNFRHAERDQADTDGTLDEDTGGSLLYLSPRVIVNLGRGLVGRAGVQIPVVRNLYGDQTEHAVVSAGLTYLF